MPTCPLLKTGPLRQHVARKLAPDGLEVAGLEHIEDWVALIARKDAS
jgi:hypothetical protein